MERVLVVLGSRERSERKSRAVSAARYLQRHPDVRTVVFSGHNGEAEELCEFARTEGVPAGVEVLLEQASIHTHDNAVKTCELLRERGLDDQMLVVVTCPYHVPRAVRTFRTQFPNVTAAVEGPWVSRAELAKFVRAEIGRIIAHGYRGHVDLGPLSAILRRVRNTKRSQTSST